MSRQVVASPGGRVAEAEVLRGDGGVARGGPRGQRRRASQR
jgi:hypothetical protein